MHAKQKFCYAVIAVISLWAVTALADSPKRAALFVVGQSATVPAGQEVESALVIGGDLQVEGNVHGFAAAVGGDLHVGPAAAVDGPAASIGGELDINKTARVKGPRLHVAGGDFSQVTAELSGTEQSPRTPFWLGSAIRLVQLLAAFVLGVFLVLWAPQQVRTVRDAVVQEPAKAMLMGLAIVLGLMPFCVLLVVSIAGIPLIPVVLLFALATFVFGLSAIAAAIGRKLRSIRDEEHLLGAMATGMLILAAGVAVPFLGALVLFVACVYGVGAVLATRFGTRPPHPHAGMKEAVPPPPTDNPITASH